MPRRSRHAVVDVGNRQRERCTIELRPFASEALPRAGGRASGDSTTRLGRPITEAERAIDRRDREHTLDRRVRREHCSAETKHAAERAGRDRRGRGPRRA
jgi:hypothetical protein